MAKSGRGDTRCAANIRISVGGGPERATRGGGSAHEAEHGMRAQPDQKLPMTGHFSDGMSQGKQTGAVRGPDAYQGARESGEDS